MAPSSRSRLPLLPLLASLALAVGIGWTLSRLTADPGSDSEAAASLKMLEQRNAEHAKQRLELQKLLEAAPCEVAQKLGVAPKTPPAPPATSGVTAAPGAKGATAAAQSPASVAPDNAPGNTPDKTPGSTTANAPASAPSIPSEGAAAKATAALLDRVEDATVMVLNIQANGDLRLGTGFFVAPGMVVTNEHVAGGKPSRFLVSNAFLEGVAPAELVAVDKKNGRDYALLRVRTAKALSIPPLSLRLDARRAEKVSAWGYPSAVSRNDPKYHALLDGNTKAVPDIIYSEGVISAVLDRKPPLIAHTTPLSPGNSGGPLVDVKGHVLGINTLISLDDESYRQTSLSLSARDLAQFLRNAGVKVRLAESAEGVTP